MAKTNQSRSQRQSQRQNRRSQRQSQRQQRSQRQSQRQQRRSKKRPMNAFMQKLNTARNSKAQSFEYNGKLYNRKVLNTGMAVYKSA